MKTVNKVIKEFVTYGNFVDNNGPRMTKNAFEKLSLIERDAFRKAVSYYFDLMIYFLDTTLAFIFSFMCCYKNAETKRKEQCFQLSKFFIRNLCLCLCLLEDGLEILLDESCTSWDLGMCH